MYWIFEILKEERELQSADILDLLVPVQNNQHYRFHSLNG
jgi:hypothetical protein